MSESIDFLSAVLLVSNDPKRLADFYRDVIDGEIPFPWPGPQLDAWQKKMIADAKTQGVRVSDEPELDAWYYRQAIAAIQRRPMSFFNASGLNA